MNAAAAAPVHVTVAVCTRNRAATLADTLASIAAMDPVACTWEVLVADNGSTDGTQAVIARFADRLPIRSVVEPRPGAANARNTSVAAARGTYMACTDDDVIVARDWLAAYVAAFARWPDADLFGGRIVPVLVEPVATWFRAAAGLLELPLAVRDLGGAPRALAPDGDHIPYGANYAVRTAVQRAFPFDPELGPGKRHFGEETTSYLAMLRAGHAGRWVPDSRVEHMIPPERQTEAYVARWFQGLGRTAAMNGEALDGPRLLGAPRWLWIRTFRRLAAYRIARLHAPPAVWVGKLIALAQDQGRISHFRDLAR